MPGGRAPRPGERFRFPEHAEALEQIAKSRGEAFYRGALAEKIEAHAEKHGGAMRAADLAAHRGLGRAAGNRLPRLHPARAAAQRPGDRRSDRTRHRAALRSASLKVDGTDSLHLQIEAMKLAFADARRYVGDLDYMDVRPQQLLGRATSNRAPRSSI